MKHFHVDLHIDSEIVDEWKENYVDYKRLRKLCHACYPLVHQAVKNKKRSPFTFAKLNEFAKAAVSRSPAGTASNTPPPRDFSQIAVEELVLTRVFTEKPLEPQSKPPGHPDATKTKESPPLKTKTLELFPSSSVFPAESTKKTDGSASIKKPTAAGARGAGEEQPADNWAGKMLVSYRKQSKRKLETEDEKEKESDRREKLTASSHSHAHQPSASAPKQYDELHDPAETRARTVSSVGILLHKAGDFVRHAAHSVVDYGKEHILGMQTHAPVQHSADQLSYLSDNDKLTLFIDELKHEIQRCNDFFVHVRDELTHSLSATIVHAQMLSPSETTTGSARANSVRDTLTVLYKRWQLLYNFATLNNLSLDSLVDHFDDHAILAANLAWEARQQIARGMPRIKSRDVLKLVHDQHSKANLTGGGTVELQPLQIRVGLAEELQPPPSENLANTSRTAPSTMSTPLLPSSDSTSSFSSPNLVASAVTAAPTLALAPAHTPVPNDRELAPVHHTSTVHKRKQHHADSRELLAVTSGPIVATAVLPPLHSHSRRRSSAAAPSTASASAVAVTSVPGQSSRAAGAEQADSLPKHTPALIKHESRDDFSLDTSGADGKENKPNFAANAHFAFHKFIRDTPMRETKPIVETIQSIVKLYAEKFEQGDFGRARIRLTSGLSRADSSLEHTYFKFGIKLGAVLVLLLWNLLSVVDFNTDQLARAYIPVFRSFGVLILWMWIWGALVTVWNKFHINWVFLFDLNPLTALTPLQVWDEAATITIMYLIVTDLFFLRSHPGWSAFNIHPGVYPFALLMYFTLKLFWPFSWPFSYWGSRRIILGSVANIIIAPFGRLLFRDMYIGNVLTSITKVITDFYYAYCFYFSGVWLLPREAYDQSECVKMQQVVIPILISLPTFWRFNQNCRRFWDSGKAWPYLGGAFKYLLGDMVTILGGLHPTFATATESWNAYRVMWFALFIFSTVYSIFWDLVMDWVLFRNKWSDKNPFLRPHLMYPPKMYYIGIVLDVLFRFGWTFQLVPLDISIVAGKPNPIFRTVISPVFMIIEVFRRGLWSIFRVEVAHLGFEDEFKKLDFVPVPITIKTKIVPSQSWKMILLETATMSILVVLTGVLVAQK